MKDKHGGILKKHFVEFRIPWVRAGKESTAAKNRKAEVGGQTLLFLFCLGFLFRFETGSYYVAKAIFHLRSLR